ncbi:uncharacterized protein LOC133554352 isoform X2 [Nerophis ophidion]|uniref:uncharacterized protein LOC133554352 isoform X2 n=1 Tax=Nerophis ophidion TaxID=159077 RepID=UPI002ADFBF7D|nr:uncharacterized protein LOC133554352 isoform X2 [Nerophis ophidion]
MWRIHSMAVALALCTLLLRGDGVMGQDDLVTEAPAEDPADDVTPAVMDADSQPEITDAPHSGASPVTDGDSDAPAGNTSPPASSPDKPSGTTAGPGAHADQGPVVVETSDSSNIIKPKPSVECVGKEEIEESRAVKAVVATIDCEYTKRLIESSNVRCHTDNCHIKVHQEGNNVQMVRNDARPHTLVEALQGEWKNELGVTNVEAPPSSSSSNRSVFVGILITGLLVAAAIVAAYCKCQRRTDSKGVKLAEETYPVDLENQGNTLVSVAPLNPPTEGQEKTNAVNGESPEAAKIEAPPPTNGHSAAKTADTEL